MRDSTLCRSLCQAAAILVLPLALGAMQGCAAPAAASANRSAPSGSGAGAIQVARPIERFDPAPVIEVRKVLLDKRLAGYLKVKLDERDGREVLYFTIYDTRFELKGFQTEQGRTFRAEAEGYVAVGTRTRDDALRMLLGGTRDTEVALAPMDAPRTIESDAAPPPSETR